MDWVHCNSCYTLPGSGKRFFLTSCGHIYCVDCKEHCADGACKLCGNPCSTIPLSSQMKPNVEVFFTDASELLKKYLIQVEQTYQFQHNHRSRLNEYHKEMVTKLKTITEEYRRVIQKAKECESERQRLLKENHYLRQALSQSRTPGSSHSTPMNFTSPNSVHHGASNDGQCTSTGQRNCPNMKDFYSPPNSTHTLQRMRLERLPTNARAGSTERGSSRSPSQLLSMKNLGIHQKESEEKLTPKEMLRRMLSGSKIQGPPSSGSVGSQASNRSRNSAFCTPESSYTPDMNSGGSGSKKMRLAQDMGKSQRKATVHPFSPNE